MIARNASLPTAAGLAVGVAGSAFIAVGLWGRREVRCALARERIVSGSDAGPPNAPVATAAGARSTAENIRRNTIEATGGRTYAEVEPYVAADGAATSDAARALKDERTGHPIESPDHELWIQSTTLQTALMHAYMAFRLSELTIGLGASFVGVGIGLVAAGHGSQR
jgi:hypothetical protein